MMKKVLMMFVMSFTLLVSCSYAAEFGAVPVSVSNPLNSYSTANKYSVADYSLSSIFTVVNLYMNNLDNSSYEQAFNEMVSAIQSKNYNIVVGNLGNSDTYSFLVFADNFDIGVYNNKPYFVALDVPHESAVGGSIVNSSYYWSGVTSATCYINKSFFDNITFSTISVKELFYLNGYCWDGESYVYKTGSGGSSGGDSSYIPTFSDDEIASIVNTFINSEDFIAHRSSGYDDFFITYDNRAEQYYAYLYKSAYDLGMVYGTFDENGNFEPNGLSEGEGYNIFCSSDSSNFLSDLWSNIKSIFQPSQYLCFRINPVINKVHYITTYSDNTMFKTSQMIFTTSEQSIVYSTKDIKLIVRDGENTLVDTDNSYTKDVLIDSSTGEEYQFELPSTPVSETPWERFLSAITYVPKSILDGLKSLFVPDLSYLNSTWEKFKEKVGFIGQAKNVVNDITNSIELNPLEPPSITIDLTKANSKYDWGTNSIVLDLSWYVPYKPAVDFVIICFSYGFFFWNLFRKLPDIINGISGDVPMMSYQAERVSNNSKRERIGF